MIRKRGKIVLLLLVLFLLIQPIPLNAQESPQDALESPNNPIEKTNKVLSTDLTIPESWEPFTRIIFGITNQNEITIAQGIILIAVWASIFIILLEISGTLFFLKTKLPRIFFSLALTLLISVSGGVYFISKLYLVLGEFFSFLDKFPAGAILLSIVLIGVIEYIIYKGTFIIRLMIKNNQAREAGERIGRSVGLTEAMNEAKTEIDDLNI